MTKSEIGKFIKINKISLDFDNPRHEPFESNEEVINYLCKHENILPLAKDIAEHGLNPLELLAVLPATKLGTYFSREGNRRVCAIKLLNDPDLAPADLRKTFEKYSDEWSSITRLPCVVFKKHKDVEIWLSRIHNGANGGVGRKQWTAQQKARHSGESRNFLALTILDLAEEIGLITASQRNNRITTVQRYLSNPLMREAFGIQIVAGEINKNRPDEDFEKILTQFINDLLDENGKKVSSRNNKKDIEKYARELMRMISLSGKVTPPKPLVRKEPDKERNKKRSKPKKPALQRKLSHYADIADALSELNNQKLQSLYFSICDISIIDHTPLVAVGVWSFMETLAATSGSTTDIKSFFSDSKLGHYGFPKGRKRKGLKEAISRIADYGNTTKHDPIAGNFASKQLANDFETIHELLLKCINEAISEK